MLLFIGIFCTSSIYAAESSSVHKHDIVFDDLPEWAVPWGIVVVIFGVVAGIIAVSIEMKNYGLQSDFRKLKNHYNDLKLENQKHKVKLDEYESYRKEALEKDDLERSVSNLQHELQDLQKHHKYLLELKDEYCQKLEQENREARGFVNELQKERIKLFESLEKIQSLGIQLNNQINELEIREEYEH